jgi:hypothetical protein
VVAAAVSRAMAVSIDNVKVTRMLDERINPTLPTVWPGDDRYPARTSSIGNHWESEVYFLEDLPPDRAIIRLVEEIGFAMHNYSYGIAEDARENYRGDAELDGGLIRIWFGIAPRQDERPSELEPIPLSAVVTMD